MRTNQTLHYIIAQHNIYGSTCVGVVIGAPSTRIARDAFAAATGDTTDYTIKTNLHFVNEVSADFREVECRYRVTESFICGVTPRTKTNHIITHEWECSLTSGNDSQMRDRVKSYREEFVNWAITPTDQQGPQPTLNFPYGTVTNLQ